MLSKSGFLLLPGIYPVFLPVAAAHGGESVEQGWCVKVDLGVPGSSPYSFTKLLGGPSANGRVCENVTN